MKGKQMQQASGRLKGKARKLAQNAPNKPAASASPAQMYIITVKDFIGLAEYIAGYKGTRVEVPSGCASSLHHAIAVRQSYGADISKVMGKTAKSQASVDQHSYFIGVLEHVRDILHPLMTESVKNMAPETGTKPADTDKLSNFFWQFGAF
jgi:hypothetical protein